MACRSTAKSVLIVCALSIGMLMPAPASAATHQILIEAMAFVPSRLVVKRGDTVVWINKDLFVHTATAEERFFDSGQMAQNARWKFVAGESGVFAYLCTLHPTMKGTLIVE
jgi:plastocyanin